MGNMHWFESRTLSSSSSSRAGFRLIQITDCHLRSDGETYHGVDSAAYLARVLLAVKAQQPDAVVVTGDITQDHTPESYLILRDLCRQILNDIPVAWLPGNHDELDCLFDSFSEPPFTPAKLLGCGGGCNSWQVLLLNSKGSTPSGVVSATHLAQIKTILQQLPQTQPVAVFCHHHLLPMNGYIDKHIMANGEALLALLSEFPQVKCISHGHVHQPQETIISRQQVDDIYLWATPSTSIQFKPGSYAADVEDSGPAFRRFDLSVDGQGNSRVKSEVINGF